MSLLNKANDTPKYWEGDLPVTSRYTYGIAGERFFRMIKENGKFIGAYCPFCQHTYVPATSYCERCLKKLDEWRDVGLEGTIFTYTILYKSLNGTHLKNPEIIAMIKLGDGGIIHRINLSKAQDIHIGMKVAAILKPKSERTGSINDILYFKPVEKN